MATKAELENKINQMQQRVDTLMDLNARQERQIESSEKVAGVIMEKSNSYQKQRDWLKSLLTHIIDGQCVEPETKLKFEWMIADNKKD